MSNQQYQVDSQDAGLHRDVACRPRPRLIDAFLKLKTDKLRGAIADLAQVLARAG
jgi:hypothetical protein